VIVDALLISEYRSWRGNFLVGRPPMPGDVSATRRCAAAPLSPRLGAAAPRPAVKASISHPAVEAARLLVAFEFDELGMHRIDATTHPDNVASTRVLEKTGMSYEGRVHDHLFVKGEW